MKWVCSRRQARLLARAGLGILILVLFHYSPSIARAQAALPSSSIWSLRVCAGQNQLPYSNREQTGFENRIMRMLANTLHAELSYVWLPELRVASQDQLLLREGKCDVLLDVADGQAGYETTLPFYQSSYVFVYRDDARIQVHSLDDSALRHLHIGVALGSPPDLALSNRGIRANVRHYFSTAGDPAKDIVGDVASGKLQVAIVWGPAASYFASQQAAKLKLVPVAPQIGATGLSMVMQVSMGLRQGDTDLRDVLNRALAADWNEVEGVLTQYHIRTIPLPQPVSVH